MQDLAYIGLTVVLFVVMALLAAGADRLGRRYGIDAETAAADGAAAQAPTSPEAGR